MIRREGKGPPSSRDLLVCFPTRAHLTLMPKPVSSPRRHLRHLHHHQNHLRKSMRGGGGGSSTGGHASPYLKQMSSENLSEPTSPKVTCAGQIKVRPRACKNWQTVMEEIERIHIGRKKKPNWVEGLGFKKEVMHFLACLRRIKFDFRCLGSFAHVDVLSDDEDEANNDKEIDQDQDHDDDEEVSSRTVFSKWFMVLQENTNNNQDCGVFSKDEKSLKLEESGDLSCLPVPANALLLMRCRSAPAKSWMEEKQEEEEQQQEKHNVNHANDDGHDGKAEEEEEHAYDAYDDDKKMEKKENKRKSLMELMKNDQSEFYKLSSEVVKETWVIGGIHKDPFSRSRSWKR